MVAASAESFDNRKDVVNLLFGFHGRIDRQWWWLAGVGLIAYRVAIGDFLLDNAAAPPQASFASIMFHTNGMPISILDVLTLWTFIALDVKRWHDLNKSGLFAMLSAATTPLSLLVAAFQLGGPFGQPNIYDFVCVGAGALSLAMFFILAFWPGTRGPNAFGDG